MNSIGARDVTLGQRECNKKKVGRWDLSLLCKGQLDIILLRLTSWNHLLQLQLSLSWKQPNQLVSKSCRLWLCQQKKMGKENNLLQDKISALELELSNAKAENLALQGRMNELQECNVLIGSTNERISAQVTAHFTEKEDLERKISELSKVPNPETFNNMVAANRMYLSEVCQFRDHCNLLTAQARSPSFLTVLQLQNPPPI